MSRKRLRCTTPEKITTQSQYDDGTVCQEQSEYFCTEEDHGVRLFDEDESDGGIFIPPEAPGDKVDDMPDETEDISDILNIEDDLDKLLLSTKPKPSPKPSPASSAGTKSNANSKPVPMTTEKDPDVALDNDDIMKYIAENADAPSASLF